MTFLMFIDGVLRSHTGAPIYQGLGLYKLLAEGNRVLLLASDKDKDSVWLKQHKINNQDSVIGTDLPSITVDPSFRQVEYCRAQGPVEAVITSDPILIKKLLEVGITSIAFLHPTYIKEEFRPDSRSGTKDWEAIVEELELQQEAYKEDPRIQ